MSSGHTLDDVRKKIGANLVFHRRGFDSIDETPIAAASIGQVHRHTDGHEVVVKV